MYGGVMERWRSSRDHMGAARGGPGDEVQPFKQMVYNVAGLSFMADDEPVHKSMTEDPNHQKFRKLLADANTLLWGSTKEGCKTFSKFSAALFALNLKSEYRIPQACFNTLLQGWYDSLPVANLMPRTLSGAPDRWFGTFQVYLLKNVPTHSILKNI